jgi:simple sugar transport system ATP-binding protein
LAIIPEDRRNQGLNLLGSIEENMISTMYYKEPFSKSVFINLSKRTRFTNDQIKRFDVRAESSTAMASTLSGGNAQKTVIARELAMNPAVLIAANPTRGLDFSAAQFVREELISLRELGVAVLLISADLDEIMQISDRILVMYEGNVVGEFCQGRITTEKLGLLMAGKVENSESISL